MFIAALFTIAKIWKKPTCPSTDKWIKVCLHTHTHRDTHSGILLNQKKKKRNFAICNNMYGPEEHSVQFSLVALSCLTLCDSTDCSTPGLPVHHQLLELTQTHVHWVGDAIQLPHPLTSPSPPAPIFPSISVFSNESAFCIRWPKYWSFSFNISPSNEHPGLISFRVDWMDLLAVQGTLKSLLQHHSSKHQFFSVQLFLQSNSHIYTWLLEKP